ARLKAHAPFYKRAFEENGLDPENLSGFGEFKDKVPLFNNGLLRKLLDQFDNDYLKVLDQLLPINPDEIDILSGTIGGSGLHNLYPMTRQDIDCVVGEALVRGAWRAGVRSNDRILYCFPLSMAFEGVPSLIGFQKLGTTVIPVGNNQSNRQILQLQENFRGTVLACSPTLAEQLVDVAPELIGKSVGDLGFKAVMCGGEPGIGIPSVKSKLEDAFGCSVFDVGAGLGFSCHHKIYQGMHWLCDDFCYYELVDPDTKEPIPLKDGAVGEAVFTVLEGSGMLLFRHSLGDIHKVFTDPCPCGQTGFRFKMLGRTDNILKVRGIMVYPDTIAQIVKKYKPQLTGNLRIVLEEKPPRVIPPLKIKLEPTESLKPEKRIALEKEVIAAMKKEIKIEPEIIWLKPGSLQGKNRSGSIFEKTYNT
ncbi:MAG: phenylacetate--CoA ligase family protein, partial [bacterium]